MAKALAAAGSTRRHGMMHLSNVGTRRDGGAADRGQLVGAEQGGDRRIGKRIDQRGNLDEPASPDDGIDHAGTEGKCKQDGNVQHGRFRPDTFGARRIFQILPGRRIDPQWC